MELNFQHAHNSRNFSVQLDLYNHITPRNKIINKKLKQTEFFLILKKAFLLSLFIRFSLVGIIHSKCQSKKIINHITILPWSVLFMFILQKFKKHHLFHNLIPDKTALPRITKLIKLDKLFLLQNHQTFSFC